MQNIATGFIDNARFYVLLQEADRSNLGSVQRDEAASRSFAI